MRAGCFDLWKNAKKSGHGTIAVVTTVENFAHFQLLAKNHESRGKKNRLLIMFWPKKVIRASFWGKYPKTSHENMVFLRSLSFRYFHIWTKPVTITSAACQFWFVFEIMHKSSLESLSIFSKYTKRKIPLPYPSCFYSKKISKLAYNILGEGSILWKSGGGHFCKPFFFYSGIDIVGDDFVQRWKKSQKMTMRVMWFSILYDFFDKIGH